MTQEQVTLKSNWGMPDFQATVYHPLSGTNLPVIICANGEAERETRNSASLSIGDLAKSHEIPFLIVEVHKFGGAGNFEKERYKDAIDYVVNLQNVDTSRIYVTGLSLSGGGVYALLADAYAAKVTAFAPICGVGDIGWQPAADNVRKLGLNVWAWDDADDANPQTHAAYDMFKMGFGMSGTPGIFTRPLSGGHTGTWAKAYGLGHDAFLTEDNPHYVNSPNLYDWFLTHQSKVTTTAVPPVTTPVVTTPVVTQPVVVKPTLTKTIQVYSDGSIIVS